MMNKMEANGNQVQLSNAEENNNEEPCKSLIQLIHNFGYAVEVYHDIETEDGYLLDIYRIPHGKANRGHTPKPVVLILHGLLTSCADYLVMGPERGLAYILADRGYDVWLGNPRGSKFSRKHKKYDPRLSKEYWNFSYHEIGIYDIPAMFSIIQKTTHCEKLSCIATSQGTTSFYVLFSERPQYCNMIKILICMAPIHTVSNLSGPFLRTLAKYPILWNPIVTACGWTHFPPEFLNRPFRYLTNFCHSQGILQSLMAHIMFMINGYDYEQMDMSEIPAMLSHIPNPTSVIHFRHFRQTFATGEFKQFDYGREENLKRYGQPTPPFYDLTKTTCPVALYYSDGGDWICSPLDVNDLKKKFPNVVMDHVIGHTKFNHLDFVYAKDVVDLLYKYVYPVLDKYSLET